MGEIRKMSVLFGWEKKASNLELCDIYLDTAVSLFLFYTTLGYLIRDILNISNIQDKSEVPQQFLYTCKYL